MNGGGITFRESIEANKRAIVSFLENTGESYTSDIMREYSGERGQRDVLTALNELKKSGVVITDDHVYMWRGKKWRLSDKTKSEEQPATDHAPIAFANWLAKNFWGYHGRIGNDAIWNQPPGTKWGDGEKKTTTELFEVFKNKKQ